MIDNSIVASLRFLFRDDEDLSRFRMKFGEEKINFGSMSKDMLLRDCFSEKMINFYSKLTGEIIIYPSVDLVGKLYGRFDLYCLIPKKNIMFDTAKQIDIFRAYTEKNKNKILSGNIDELIFPSGKSIKGVSGYFGYSILMESAFHDAVAYATDGAIKLGRLLNGKGEIIMGSGFVKCNVLSFNYVDDGGLRDVHRGGGWYGYKVVPQDLLECKDKAFSLNDCFDEYGFRPVIYKKDVLEKMRKEKILEKFLIEPVLIEGSEIQTKHQEIWRDIRNFVGLNRNGAIY